MPTTPGWYPPSTARSNMGRSESMVIASARLARHAQEMRDAAPLPRSLAPPILAQCLDGARIGHPPSLARLLRRRMRR